MLNSESWQFFHCAPNLANRLLKNYDTWRGRQLGRMARRERGRIPEWGCNRVSNAARRPKCRTPRGLRAFWLSAALPGAGLHLALRSRSETAAGIGAVARLADGQNSLQRRIS